MTDPQADPVPGALVGLVDALAAADAGRLRDAFAPDAVLQALLPRRSVEATGADAVVATMLDWVDDVPHLDAARTRFARVGEVWRVDYRFTAPGIVMEQVAYCQLADDRVTRIRVLCSGSRPVEPGSARQLDARGDTCATLTPRIAAELKATGPGQLLAVLTDDPAAADGIAAWSRLAGHPLVATAADPRGTRYYLRRRTP